MPKRLLEDMVKTKHTIIETRQESGLKDIREPAKIKTNYDKKRPRYMLWLVAVVSVVFCFFAISFLFAKAEVLVDPKTQDVVLNENLSASKDSNIGNLSFNLVIIPGEESKTLQATTEKNIATAATGTVVIFNTLNTSPQKLAVDTRLEGSNGKIYKTQTATIVPGMSKDGTPGQVQVGIYGNDTGSDYNSSDPLDFTIIGFKGTPKSSAFKVRSKPGTEISGGFKGQAPAISEADEAIAESDLKNSLEATLLQQATDQIPSGFILFKDAIFLDSDDSNISTSYNKDNSMTLTRSGTLYGILFNEQMLTQKIATDNIDKYDGSDVYIPSIRDLTFSLTNQDNVSFNNVQNINFNLSGPAKIVWKLDADKFTADLLGKSKNDFTQILSQYSNIDSATLTLTPIWKMSIPDQAKNVKVIVNYPQ